MPPLLTQACCSCWQAGGGGLVSFPWGTLDFPLFSLRFGWTRSSSGGGTDCVSDSGACGGASGGGRGGRTVEYLYRTSEHVSGALKKSSVGLPTRAAAAD